MQKAIFKVPEGKLLKIFLQSDGKTIQSVKITGDFFIHPEEKILQLEEALTGLPLNETQLQIALEQTIQKENLELIGVDAHSIASTILLAAHS